MGAVVSGGCAGDREAGSTPQPEDSDEALKWHIGSLGYCTVSNHFDLGRTLGKGSYGHVRYSLSALLARPISVYVTTASLFSSVHISWLLKSDS